MSDPIVPGDLFARHQTITGLRQLADYLEANPAVPVEEYGQCYTFFPRREDDACGRAEVDRVAALLGVLVCDDSERSLTRWPGSPPPSENSAPPAWPLAAKQDATSGGHPLTLLDKGDPLIVPHPALTPLAARDMADKLNRPDFHRWAARAKATGGCLQPIHLRGRVDHIDPATGALLHRYSTAHQPG